MDKFKEAIKLINRIADKELNNKCSHVWENQTSVLDFKTVGKCEYVCQLCGKRKIVSSTDNGFKTRYI